ncbi:5028_t:CDS:2 [Entrophospora sp. SA101]|nr:5028_t:CDS:2 [Entrophospora sp. SA101]
MTKQELIIKLESFLELMGENCRCKYRGFRSKNKSDLLIILQEPIPITKEKAIAQEDELKMTKRELIIKSKNKDDLLVILQEVRCLFNEGNEIDDSDSVESSN